MTGTQGGIALRPGAVVLFGSAFPCTRPAVVDLERARKHIPEWRTLVAEDVGRDSARWHILWSQIHGRLRGAAADAARAQGVDCVVDEGDLLDAGGLPVADLTAAVLAELRR